MSNQPVSETDKNLLAKAEALAKEYYKNPTDVDVMVVKIILQTGYIMALQEQASKIGETPIER